MSEMNLVPFEIDGASYVTTPHGPMAGLAVIDHLMALAIGPVLSAVAADGDGLAAIDSAAVTRALQTSGGLTKLAPMLLAHTTRDGKFLDRKGIEVSFPRKYGEMMKACMEVIKINGFFDVLHGLMESDLVKSLTEEDEATDPSTSAGS